MITVNNWDVYQENNTQDNTQTTHNLTLKQHSNNTQTTPTKEIKNIRNKEVKKDNIPPLPPKENFEEKVDPLKIPVDKIKDLWNEIINPTIPVSLSFTLRQKIVDRWNERAENRDIEFWRKVFNIAKKTKLKDWKPTFDWVFQDDRNYMKLIEGNYDKSNNGHDIIKEASERMLPHVQRIIARSGARNPNLL